MIAFALAAACLLAPSDPPVLDASTLDRWLATIQPSAEESAWRRIGWRSSFWDGLRDGQAAKKPILLWAMNGHPLGCT